MAWLRGKGVRSRPRLFKGHSSDTIDVSDKRVGKVLVVGDLIRFLIFCLLACLGSPSFWRCPLEIKAAQISLQ